MPFRSFKALSGDYLLLAVVFLIGAFFRFYGASEVPLSVDEYYLTKSTLSIMQNGLPDFSFGGYYTRGLLQQYLSAIFIFLFGDVEFSMRLTPMLAGLVTAVGVYKLTQLIANPKLAILSATIILFSVWEIEFSRFARMYALHQALFTWQAYFLVRALFYGEAKKFTYAVILAVIAAATSEGAVFSIAICFLPLLICPKIYRLRDILLIALALLSMLILIFVDWRHLGVEGWLPDDLDITLFAGMVNHKINIPQLPLSSLISDSPYPLIAYLLLVSITVLLIFRYIVLQNKDVLRTILTVVLLALPAVHLPGFALLLTAALWLIFFFDQNATRNFRVALSIGVYTLIWLCLWTSSELTSGSGHTLKTILKSLLMYPDFWDQWLTPWSHYMPIMTATICIGFALAIVTHFFGTSKQAHSLRFLCALVLLTLTLFGLINTNYTTSRYSYFLYPLFITLLIAGVYGIARKTRLPGKLPLIATSVVVTSTFIFSDDFNLKHAWHINDYEFIYRTYYPAYKRDHYKVRYDIESAAQFIQEASSPCDTVVSVIHETELYLSSFQYFYIEESSIEVLSISANGGQNDLWTGRTLLRKESDLQALMNSNSCTTWFIMRPHLLPDWMKTHVVYETPSEQLIVVSSENYRAEN